MTNTYYVFFGAIVLVSIIIMLNLCTIGIHEEEDKVIVSGLDGITVTNLGVSNCKRCDKKFLFLHTLGGATGNVKRQRRTIPEDMYLELKTTYSESQEMSIVELWEITYDVCEKYGLV